MTKKRKKRQRLPHHRTLPTKLLPAPPLSHNPQQLRTTHSKSSHLDEAQKRKRRVWRTPTPVTISCLVPQAARRGARRTRRRMLRRRTAMMTGSRWGVYSCLVGLPGAQTKCLNYHYHSSLCLQLRFTHRCSVHAGRLFCFERTL